MVLPNNNSQLKKTAISLLLLILGISTYAQEASRKEYNFNPDWKIKAGDIKGAEQ